MNEQLDKLIKSSGEMWASRNKVDSPVIVKFGRAFGGGQVYELSLPEGEPHPYWRINEREINAQEAVSLSEAYHSGDVDRIGDLIYHGNTYLRTVAYIYNGRKPYVWTRHVEFVEIVESKVTELRTAPLEKEDMAV